MAETQKDTTQSAPSIPTATLKAWLAKVNKNEALDLSSFKKLCEAAMAVFKAESNVFDLTAPLTLVGDIHGQFSDLKEVLRLAGSPAETKYLFMGNLVDKGPHSTLCVQLVFILKLLFPTNVYLIRGNHESAKISSIYGFLQDLTTIYNEEGGAIHHECCTVFNDLPLAAVVNEKTLVIHGGLSPTICDMQYLRSMPRGQVEMTGALTDLLWSDPDDAVSLFATCPRGAGFLWGPLVTNTFCDANGIDMIIRSHQLTNQEGYFYVHNDRVLTIWTASNYSQKHNNKGAFLKLGAELEKNIVQFPIGSAEEHAAEASAFLEDVIKAIN